MKHDPIILDSHMLFAVAMLAVSIGLPMFCMPATSQMSSKELIILGLWHSLMAVPLIRILLSIVITIEYHGHRLFRWLLHPICMIGIGILLAKINPYDCVDRISHVYQLYSDTCFALTRFVMFSSNPNCVCPVNL